MIQYFSAEFSSHEFCLSFFNSNNALKALSHDSTILLSAHIAEKSEATSFVATIQIL